MSPRCARAALLVLGPFVAASCSLVETIGVLVHEDAPRERALLSDDAEPPSVLAAMQAGAFVLVDATSSTVVAQAAMESSGGPPDLAAGFWGGHTTSLVARTVADEDGGGEVLLFSVGAAGALDGPTTLGRVEGATALIATPFGPVVMQDDLGQRWRLLPAAGGTTPSVACGVAGSFRVVSADATHLRLEALAPWPEGGLSSLDVVVEATGVTRCEPTPIQGHAGASSAARLVDFGVGYERALADVVDGALWLGALDGDAVVDSLQIPLGAAQLEDARRVSVSGDVATFVALGSSPARLAWLDVALGEDGALELAGADVISLASDVVPSGRFPSRALALTEAGVHVATTAGVLTFVRGEEGALVAAGSSARLAGPITAVPIP